MLYEITEQTPTADILLTNLTGRDYEGLHADPPNIDSLTTLHLFGQFTCLDAGRDSYAGLAFWPAHFREIIQGALLHYRMATNAGWAKHCGDTRSSIDRQISGCEARANLVTVICAAEEAVRLL